MWTIDAVTFGLLTPLLVIAAFAGVGDGPLRPAESSTFLQTILAALVVLVGLAIFAAARFRGALYPVALLPAVLAAPGIALAYDDFRLTPVAMGLSFVWLVSALGTLVVRLLTRRPAQALPFALYAACMVVVLTLRPGLATLGGRPAPVGASVPLFLIAGAAILVLPEFLARSSSQNPRQPRRRSRRSAGPPA
jgi:hypothetical protein